MNGQRGKPVLVMLILAACGAWRGAAACPQEAPKNQEALHNELREFRKGLVDAVEKQDLDRMLSFLTKDVVVTWQNSEVSRGHEGVRKFFERVQAKPEKMFQGYKVPPNPDELTVIYNGNTGISFGTETGIYKAEGHTFEMTNRWTATLVKVGDKWQAASYHVSTNVADNPVVDAVKSALVRWVVVAFLAGGVLVLGGLWLRVKMKQAPSTTS